jgi:poly(3-hydroxyoctanoate) depolymerase
MPDGPGEIPGDYIGILRVDGLSLNVRVDGEGPVLVLINGIGGGLGGWAPIEPWLAGRRVVRFDAPGAGSSPTPGWPMSLRRVARATGALLTRLGVTECDVLGVSLGGAVAQELAWAEPRRVRRLVLVSTTCGWGGLPLTPAATMALLRADRFHRRGLYQRLAPRLVGGRTTADAGELARYLDARLTEGADLRGYLWQAVAASVWSSVLWLHRVRQPALVVHGTADPLIHPVNARLLAALLPAGRVRLVAGGHLVLLDSPDLVMPLVVAFLDRGDG